MYSLWCCKNVFLLLAGFGSPWAQTIRAWPCKSVINNVFFELCNSNLRRALPPKYDLLDLPSSHSLEIAVNMKFKTWNNKNIISTILSEAWACVVLYLGRFKVLSAKYHFHWNYYRYKCFGFITQRVLIFECRKGGGILSTWLTECLESSIFNVVL